MVFEIRGHPAFRVRDGVTIEPGEAHTLADLWQSFFCKCHHVLMSMSRAMQAGCFGSEDHASIYGCGCRGAPGLATRMATDSWARSSGVEFAHIINHQVIATATAGIWRSEMIRIFDFIAPDKTTGLIVQKSHVVLQKLVVIFKHIKGMLRAYGEWMILW